MMATSIELPTKREYEHEGGEEEVASKKAKTEEAEAGSHDEIMSDSVAKQEEEKKEFWSDDEFPFMSYISAEQEEEEKKEEEKKKEEALVREYQLFLELKGDSDRAKKISSEKDALDMFSDDETGLLWQMYWRKNWHILPNPGCLSDYQRLAIYYSEDDRYYGYVHFYHSHDFDCKYQKFTKELNETIQWDTNLSDAYIIAEEIWKRHMEVAINLYLLNQSISMARYLSNVKQEAKELIPLFVDIYKREVDGEDFLQELKVIIGEKGFECYPLIKFFSEKALKEEDGPWERIRLKYDAMKRRIRNEKGEASLEDSWLKDLVTGYFEDRLMSSGDNYIDYVEDKIRVARELKIL